MHHIQPQLYGKAPLDNRSLELEPEGGFQKQVKIVDILGFRHISGCRAGQVHTHTHHVHFPIYYYASACSEGQVPFSATSKGWGHLEVIITSPHILLYRVDWPVRKSDAPTSWMKAGIARLINHTHTHTHTHTHVLEITSSSGMVELSRECARVVATV